MTESSPSWGSVVFVCWTIPLQDNTAVCHDCLVVNGQFIINIPSRHDCLGVNVWSPAGNYNKSVNVWSLARAPETRYRIWGWKACKPVQQKMETVE